MYSVLLLTLQSLILWQEVIADKTLWKYTKTMPWFGDATRTISLATSRAKHSRMKQLAALRPLRYPASPR
jgi:hypothetical protein